MGIRGGPGVTVDLSGTRAGGLGGAAWVTRPHKPYHRAPDSATKRSWFQLRVGPGDLARIDALSAALGVTRSEAVRRAVERLAEDLLPENH